MQQTARGVVLSVKVIPRSSRNQIEVDSEVDFRIKVTSPPVDGAANQAIIELISSYFHLARSRVEVIGGQKSKHKRLLVKDFSIAEIQGIMDF